jgi:hypothetical protein
MNNIMDLLDFERRGEYVLADVKSATWFFEWIQFDAEPRCSKVVY